MQVPTSLPTLAPVALTWIDTAPPSLVFALGVCLVGLAGSVTTAQLRAAFPATLSATRTALHGLYPALFGAASATIAAPLLPGLDASTRWLVGIVAPYLWAPLYTYLKTHYGKGLSLPAAADLFPPPPPTDGASHDPR